MGTHPSTVPQAFELYHETLKLDPIEHQLVIDTHNDVTRILKDAGLIEDFFLQGSFRRGTMIDPLRDVDKVVIIPAARFSELDRHGGPDQIMTEIRKVLEVPYGEKVRFDVTNHSLVMDFGTGSFDFDIVPAFADAGQMVSIANRSGGDDRERIYWKPSNTKELIKAISDRNGDCQGQWIYQARMIKQFVKTNCPGHLPGLHVEAIQYATITTRLAHDEACARILEAGAHLLEAGYRDPTGAETLSDRLSEFDRPIALQRFKESAELAREAVDLAADHDDRAAIAIWHDLFGQPFPEPEAVAERAALSQMLTAATITSGRTPSKSLAGVQPSTPSRAWSPE
jgi:hypothetical protein